MSNVAESASCTGPKRKKLWIKYHKEVSSQEFVAKWKEFACEIGVRVTALFFQHITDDLFNAILKEKIQYTRNNDINELPDLAYEEQSAVHYVGGYVLGLRRLCRHNFGHNGH